MKSILTIPLSLLLVFAAADAYSDDKSNREQEKITKEQAEIRKMRSETLNDLYSEKSEARDEVEDSHAVAVFTSVGLNLFLLSTARGGGIVRETGTGNETFMRMFSVGGGFGMGVKDFRVIFIFHTKTGYENFLNSGWDFSGQADAAAKSGEKGRSEEGAGTVIDGVTLYQITESGLALQVTLQGTKYYKDKDLN